MSGPRGVVSGARAAQVQCSGAALGYVSGLLQVNLQVPTTIDIGDLIHLPDA